MAGFKLMSIMTDHFKAIQEGSLITNMNKGLVIDPLRYSSMQKPPEQFAKTGKVGYNYNNKNNFDTQSDVNNFAANQLQQIGYTYNG
jgi:hypothetical protein